ncbi:hypothetical protein D3C71_2242690 [compost metagenome]
MTERLTKVKATRAPKLITEVAVTRSKKMADSEMKPTMTMLMAGVFHLPCRRPK